MASTLLSTSSSWILGMLALVLRILLWPLRMIVARLFPPLEFDGLSPAVTAKAAQHFVSYLRSLQQQQQQQQHRQQHHRQNQNRQAINVMDVWLTTGFVAAKQEAQQRNALLLVYLHAPLHAQSAKFCQSTLLSPAMLQFLQASPHMLAFGVSLHAAQGAQLAQLLNATAFPLVAVLQIPPNSSNSSSSSSSSSSRSSTTTATTMNLLLRAEGPALMDWPVDHMLQCLQSALTRHDVQVAEQVALQLQRQQEAELRREQDEEYQAALLQDQERERERKRKQEEERQRELRELERERQEQENKQAALNEAKTLLGAEPESGGTMVRFVLPSGVKLNRRFAVGDTVGTLKAYLTLHFHENEIEMGRIGLSTSFPRKTYNDDDDLTLEDAGLSPQAVLMVQDLDA